MEHIENPGLVMLHIKNGVNLQISYLFYSDSNGHEVMITD